VLEKMVLGPVERRPREGRGTLGHAGHRWQIVDAKLLGKLARSARQVSLTGSLP
jgi:hypothetical protein